MRQPIALRVPNSRTRRETAAIMRRPATRKATASAATESHRPRLDVRVEALESAPLTSLARSAEVETVAEGSAAFTSAATVETCEALETETKTVVIFPFRSASFWAVASGR